MRNAAALALTFLFLVSIAWSQTTPAPSNQTATSANPETGSQQTAAPQPSTEDPRAGQAPPAQNTTPPQEPSTGPVLEHRAPESAANPAGVVTVPAGTEIKATLDTPLSSKTSKPGDRFTATLNQPLMATDGHIGIPSGTRINGEVAQAESGRVLPSVRGKGRLNLRFREFVLNDGTRIPLTATLVSVRDTSGTRPGNTDEEGQVESRTSGTEVAKNVGIGAAVGTVAGLIFGSALKGLAIGAAAGGGYVLAAKGKDVNIPANSGLVLRLDQVITVPTSPPPARGEPGNPR